MATVSSLPDRVQIHVTASELRKLADKVETFYRDLQLGETTLVETWVGDNVELLIHVDQEKMPYRFTALSSELMPGDVFWHGDKKFTCFGIPKHDPANRYYAIDVDANGLKTFIGERTMLTIERERRR